MGLYGTLAPPPPSTPHSPPLKQLASTPPPQNISSLSPSPCPVQTQPSKGTVRSQPELHHPRARTPASPASPRVAGATAQNCAKTPDRRLEVAAFALLNPFSPRFRRRASRSPGRGKLSSLLKYPKNEPMFPVSAGIGGQGRLFRAQRRERAAGRAASASDPRTHHRSGTVRARGDVSVVSPGLSGSQSGCFPALNGKKSAVQTVEGAVASAERDRER